MSLAVPAVISLLSMSFCLAGGCSGDASLVSSSEDLRAVLAEATAGDRVCLTEGVFEGSFDVPAGVVLCGAGVGRTRVVGAANVPTLRVTPGEVTATTITGLTVEPTGAFGILAMGLGEVDVADVEVLVGATGGGIGAERLSALRLSNLQVGGPVTSLNAGEMVADTDLALAPAHGVVLTSVMSVVGSRLDVAGFSQVGMLLIESGVTLTDGHIGSNLGAGLVVHGGSAELRGVVVDGTLQGNRAPTASNVVFAGNADISTTDVVVSASEGYGMVQAQATATHVDLVLTANHDGALWVQNSGGLSITNGSISDNGLVGVIAIESTGIHLENLEIQGTLERTRTMGLTGRLVVADGIDLVGTTSNVTLEAIRLSDNARVGILFELEGGSIDDVDIRSIAIEGAGTQLGAIAQNGLIAPGWDANITRCAVIEANDAAFTGTLGTAPPALVSPSF